MSKVSVDDHKAQDTIWLSLVAQGGRAGEKSLEQLYRKYRRPLIAFLCRQGSNSHMAEDVVQEVFIKLQRSAVSFRGNCAVSSWLHGIARHLYIDHMRSTKKEFCLDDDGWRLVETTIETRNTCAFSPDPQQAVQDCFDQAYASFAKAHPAAADVVYSTMLHGWSTKDLSEFLQRTESATREYLSQCRKKLKVFVEPCRDLLGDLP